MDDIALNKAWSRLIAFREHLQPIDVREDYVAEHHNILHALEQETGHQLGDFLTPDSMLQRRVIGFGSPRIGRRAGSETSYSESRYCEHAFFLMRLSAAINFFSSLVPEETRRRIGF